MNLARAGLFHRLDGSGSILSYMTAQAQNSKGCNALLSRQRCQTAYVHAGA